ncbi:TTL-domain-containing protein, partial [Aureobasidium melanogenum]
MAEQQTSTAKIHAVVDYEDRYVQPLILAALKSRMPADVLVLTQSISDAPASDAKLLQWKQYESLDLDHVMENSQTSLMNSYIIRKALIRKHYLSTTVSHWLTKNPESCLRKNVKPSVEFELDFAEFLDDALVEAFELRESFEQNEGLEDSEKQWWILKPGMSDRGQGIRLFNSEEDLTAIFESWEEESDDEEAEHSGDEDEQKVDDDEDEGDGLITSQLRHFIAQPYIHPPLLLPSPFASADRKFHIRTYVLAVGALKVFVYKPMLALFAGKTYTAPWE